MRLYRAPALLLLLRGLTAVLQAARPVILVRGVGADADARAIWANQEGKVNIDGDAVVLVQAVSGTAEAKEESKAAAAKTDATGRGLAAFGGEIKVTGTTAVNLLAQGGTAASAGSGASARTNAYGVYASGSKGKIELQGAAVIHVQALGGTASRQGPGVILIMQRLWRSG